MSDLLAEDLSIWLHDSVPVKPEVIFFSEVLFRFHSNHFTITLHILLTNNKINF